MASQSVIDSRLFIRLDLDLSLKANSLFEKNVANRAHLASQLLLYDSIVIPTTDFGIVPVLISWFGLKHFEAALGSSTLRFLRRNTLLGYVGNGNGISTFGILPGKDKPFEWWQAAMFGDTDVSLELQLKYMCPFIPSKQRQKLVTSILSQSKDVIYDNEFFMKQIVHESYTDVMENEHLVQFILTRTKKKGESVNLSWLEGVGPNQMRVIRQDGAIKDAVDLVLRVAEINMEILMSTQADNADILTTQGAEMILAQKLTRAGLDKSLVDGFVQLLDLNNIPDIRAAIATDSVTLSDIWKIRQTKNARKFRQWLRKAAPKDSRELEKAYVQALGRSSLADSLPITGLRFALTATVGLLNPVIGFVTDAIDSFFVDKWLSGYSPKLFLDELVKLSTDKER